MPLNPAIPLSVEPPHFQSPTESMGEMLKLRLGQAQAGNAELLYDQNRKQVDIQERSRQILRETPDYEAAIDRIQREVDPFLGGQMATEYAENKRKQADWVSKHDSDALKLLTDQSGLVSDQAYAVMQQPDSASMSGSYRSMWDAVKRANIPTKDHDGSMILPPPDAFEQLATEHPEQARELLQDVFRHGKTQKQIAEAEVAKRQAQASQVTDTGKGLELIGQLAGGVVSTEQIAALRKTAADAGVPASALAAMPTTYDPVTWSRFVQSTVPRSSALGSDYAQYLGTVAGEKGRPLTAAEQIAERTRFANADDRQTGGTAGLSQDAVDYTATQYRILGPSGIPTRVEAADRVRILNAAAEQTKLMGQSPAQAVQKQAAYRADAGALNRMRVMSSAAGAFEAKATEQAKIIRELSKKVPRAQWPIINRAVLAGKIEIAGDTNAQLLANAVQTFTSEYAKLIEGSTGSAAGSSDSSRRATERLLNPAFNQGTMDGSLTLMEREMRLTLQGYDSVINSITERMGGVVPPPETAGPAGLSPPQGVTGQAGGPALGPKVTVTSPSGRTYTYDSQAAADAAVARAKAAGLWK